MIADGFRAACLALLAGMLGWLAFETRTDVQVEPIRRDLAAGRSLVSPDTDRALQPDRQVFWDVGARGDFFAALLLASSSDDPAHYDAAAAHSIRALERAPAQPLYWHRLASARYGTGDDIGAAAALSTSYSWGGVLDDAAIARIRLSDRLWDRLDEPTRRAVLRELRLLGDDRRLLNALAGTYSSLSPDFRREILAALEPPERVHFIRRIRAHGAGRL
ncbi:MAG: hypothetical protein ACFE0P_03060 [Oceanicaulis sp.]